MMISRTCRLKRFGKAILTCIVSVNLLCIVTLCYNHSFPADDLDEHMAEHVQHMQLASRQDSQIHLYNSPCDNLRAPPPLNASNERSSWQTVTKQETYIYSAFYDNRTHLANVVILGISKGYNPKKWCQLWYPNRVIIVESKYDIVPETHGRRYAPSFHSCPVSTKGSPYAVSLVQEKCDVSKNLLKVNPTIIRTHPEHAPLGTRHPFLTFKPQRSTEPVARKYSHDGASSLSFKYNYTVCVTPLNFKFNKITTLVEMIEVNKMFGADHFVFYNYESGKDVMPYFDYYQRKGMVELLSWDLPVKVDVWPPVEGHEPEIHYFAQLVALNDCVYRSMSNSRYAVLTDLDEIIVPYKDSSWDAMLARVSAPGYPHSNKFISTLQSPPSDIASWMFRNVFFRLDWGDDQEMKKQISPLEITTLLKTKREDYIFPENMRSKVIVRPQLISASGVHFVHSTLHLGAKSISVNPDDARLHHYRLGFDTQDDSQSVQETVMHKYKIEIVNAVNKVLQELL